MNVYSLKSQKFTPSMVWLGSVVKSMLFLVTSPLSIPGASFIFSDGGAENLETAEKMYFTVQICPGLCVELICKNDGTAALIYKEMSVCTSCDFNDRVGTWHNMLTLLVSLLDFFGRGTSQKGARLHNLTVAVSKLVQFKKPALLAVCLPTIEEAERLLTQGFGVDAVLVDCSNASGGEDTKVLIFREDERLCTWMHGQSWKAERLDGLNPTLTCFSSERSLGATQGALAAAGDVAWLWPEATK